MVEKNKTGTDSQNAEASIVSPSDPGSLRALAHPLRLRLLGELRVRGPQSVGMLAELVDEAPGSVSYHLGTLAKHGYVVEAPELARDRRERWWRAAHESTHLPRTNLVDDPARRDASLSLRRSIQQAYWSAAQRYLELEATLAAEWIEAASSSDRFAYLTAAELKELNREMDAVAEKWEALSDADRPGAESVQVIYQAFRRL